MKSIRTPSMVTHKLSIHFRTLALILFSLFLSSTLLNAQISQHSSTSSYAVVYNFTGSIDGGSPYAGVVLSPAGNLYGTTQVGGAYGFGTVYQLTPSPGGWTETVLHSFTGGSDGADPRGQLIGGDGYLAGTTYQGGDPGCNCGTVFGLDNTGNGWTLQTIHAFLGGSGGANPAAGLLDLFGSWYGTTVAGGNVRNPFCRHLGGCGTIFRIDPMGEHHVWSTFSSGGWSPKCTLAADPYYSCLFGTTTGGQGPDKDYGTVFMTCDPGYRPVTKHAFGGKGKAGWVPMAGLVFDEQGNAYGTTSEGYQYCGAVFEIVDAADGGRKTKTLYQFTCGGDGAHPKAELIFDSIGNLYGTTFSGGAYGNGVVFKLTPGLKNKWTETVLYSFSGIDGASPTSKLTIDDAGNLYGTTTAGGAYGGGVVFKITP